MRTMWMQSRRLRYHVTAMGEARTRLRVGLERRLIGVALDGVPPGNVAEATQTFQFSLRMSLHDMRKENWMSRRRGDP